MSAWKRLLAIEDKSDVPAPSSSDPWARATTDSSSAAVPDGFSRARRSRSSASVWRWTKGVAVGLLLVAGFLQVVVKPIRAAIGGDEAPPAPAASIDMDAAAAAASGFAVDYLSSGGAGGESARAAALSQWLYPGAFSQSGAVGTWEGSDVVIADSASVQEQLQVGADAAVIAVQVRIRTYAPGEGSNDVPPPAAPDGGSPAFVPVVPAGYTAGPAYWVRLAVPLVDSEAGPRVVGPSPIFTNDDLAPLPISVESDREGTEKITAAAQTIFEAYASGELTYVAAEDSHLTGLSGTVSVATVGAIRTSAAANKNGSRNLSAEITWQLTGVDARITQTYAISVSDINSSAPQLQRVGVRQPVRPDDS
ncbi:MAG: hypothetical protein ACK5MR_16900 [Cumulibacter sp.]